METMKCTYFNGNLRCSQEAPLGMLTEKKLIFKFL